MNGLVRLAAIGMTGGLLALVLKSRSRDSAILVTLMTSVVIAGAILSDIAELISEIYSIMEKCEIDMKYFAICIKAVGLAYISQFGAEILRDSGEGAIASKVEAAGKIAILLLTMPVLKSFLELCIKVVNGI